jgi:hypothetical protein
VDTEEPPIDELGDLQSQLTSSMELQLMNEREAMELDKRVKGLEKLQSELGEMKEGFSNCVVYIEDMWGTSAPLHQVSKELDFVTTLIPALSRLSVHFGIYHLLNTSFKQFLNYCLDSLLGNSSKHGLVAQQVRSLIEHISQKITPDINA